MTVAPKTEHSRCRGGAILLTKLFDRGLNMRAPYHNLRSVSRHSKICLSVYSSSRIRGKQGLPFRQNPSQRGSHLESLVCFQIESNSNSPIGWRRNCSYVKRLSRREDQSSVYLLHWPMPPLVLSRTPHRLIPPARSSLPLRPLLQGETGLW
jgi:hypothetical protein